MNRRRLLWIVAGATAVPYSLAGCTANETTGRTYRLAMAEATTAPDDPLNLDNSGITPGQEDIVAEAVANGRYVEENVNWSTLPGREGITMSFKQLLQQFARHVGRDPTLDEPTSFDVPTRYGRSAYVATVDVDAD